MSQPRYERLGVIRVIGGIIIGVSITDMLGAPLTATLLPPVIALLTKVAGCLAIAVALVCAEDAFLGTTHLYNVGPADDLTKARKRQAVNRASLAIAALLLSLAVALRLRDWNAVLTLALGYGFILYDLIDRRSDLKIRTTEVKFLRNEADELCLIIRNALADLAAIAPDAGPTGYHLVYLDGRRVYMPTAFVPAIWEVMMANDRLLIVHLDEHGHFSHEYTARIDREAKASP